MRLLVLIPDLVIEQPRRALHEWLARHPQLNTLTAVRQRVVHPALYTPVAWGGTLNLMRHAAVARSLGAEACLLTPSGRDTYGRFKVGDVPFERWDRRRPDDLVLIPDFCTALVEQVEGPCIAYLQAPNLLHADFDYRHDRVKLWTDSPFMLERCREVFLGKDIAIVPNIIDPVAFPFRQQAERDRGLIFAFPRKGADFIEATRRRYQELGGSYWHFELIDGVPLAELAARMRRPQAFLASADVEGCALPPQESMAAGIVVVGKSARGANFSMEHKKTAMVAETAEEAAMALRELEDDALRDTISRNARDFIARYFPDGEPAALWRRTLGEHGFELKPLDQGVGSDDKTTSPRRHRR